MAAERLSTDESLAGLRVILTVHSASGLVAKDRNMFGKKTSSDPYAKVYFGDKAVGKTAVKKKTLEPVWETRVKHTLGINDAERVRHAAPSASSVGAVPSFVVALFDHDVASADDPMGQVTVPVTLNGIAAETFQVVPGRPKSRGHCKNAKGTIKISVQVSTVLLPDIVAGNVLPLQMAKKHSRLRVGLGWNVTRMQKPIDLDLSCVAIDARGKVSMDETVYFSNLQNPSGSIVHSGDEREGSARVLGSDTDDREQITIDMDRLPAHVAAYVLLATVATPSTDFSEITSARVRVIDGHDGLGFCAFRPAFEGACTALFCLRLSREPKGGGTFGKKWKLATIGATDDGARDFGSLIPEIKGFCRDLFPGADIDPNERVAVMNKESTIRIRDYAPERNVLPQVVAMGLAWDLTDGCNIDLDASAVCLDRDNNLVDLVYFKNLRSADGAIHHSGDEREGDEVGDDEKIIVALNAVDPRVEHIVFMINSYSEEELDDIAMASCHLFDPVKRVDICTYTLTNNKDLDGHTAVILADLYRDASTREWMMRIISKPTQGKTARRCLSAIGQFLRTTRPGTANVPPNPDVVATAMPEAVPLETDISFVPDEAEYTVIANAVR